MQSYDESTSLTRPNSQFRCTVNSNSIKGYFCTATVAATVGLLLATGLFFNDWKDDNSTKPAPFLLTGSSLGFAMGLILAVLLDQCGLPSLTASDELANSVTTVTSFSTHGGILPFIFAKIIGKNPEVMELPENSYDYDSTFEL